MVNQNLYNSISKQKLIEFPTKLGNSLLNFLLQQKSSLSIWCREEKADAHTGSCDRSSSDGVDPNFKRELLSRGPDLTKLNPKCHMNYLNYLLQKIVSYFTKNLLVQNNSRH